jgi:hypothetical protein
MLCNLHRPSLQPLEQSHCHQARATYATPEARSKYPDVYVVVHAHCTNIPTILSLVGTDQRTETEYGELQSFSPVVEHSQHSRRYPEERTCASQWILLRSNIG